MMSTTIVREAGTGSYSLSPSAVAESWTRLRQRSNTSSRGGVNWKTDRVMPFAFALFYPEVGKEVGGGSLVLGATGEEDALSSLAGLPDEAANDLPRV